MTKSEIEKSLEQYGLHDYAKAQAVQFRLLEGRPRFTKPFDYKEGMHGEYHEEPYGQYGLSSNYNVQIFAFASHEESVERTIEVLESDVEALKKYLTSLKNSRV